MRKGDEPLLGGLFPLVKRPEAFVPLADLGRLIAAAYLLDQPDVFWYYTAKCIRHVVLPSSRITRHPLMDRVPERVWGEQNLLQSVEEISHSDDYRAFGASQTSTQRCSSEE